MRALNAWLIQRPIVNGLIVGGASYVGYLGGLAYIGRSHGWLAPLPFALSVVVVKSIAGYAQKGGRTRRRA